MQYNSTDNKYFVESCSDLVIWSGGVDSTYILNDLLSKSSVDKPVGALSINHYFLFKGKIFGENVMRNKFIETVINENKYPFVHDVIEFTNSGTNHNVRNGTGQLTTWLMYAHSVAKDDATIHLGILKTDSQVSHYTNLHKLVDTLNDITGKHVKLSFPLIQHSKLDMIKLLFKECLEDKVWVCEMPIEDTSNKEVSYHQCGGKNCAPCKNHIQNLLLFRIMKTGVKEMTNRIDAHLEESFGIKFKSYQSMKDYIRDDYFLF